MAAAVHSISASRDRRRPRRQACAFDHEGLHAVKLLISDHIDRLIAVLDRLDPDPDEEPSLGWTRTFATGTTDDREQEHDGREEDR